MQVGCLSSVHIRKHISLVGLDDLHVVVYVPGQQLAISYRKHTDDRWKTAMELTLPFFYNLTLV